jgi:SOS-response transcriptional repressors (RecA-mediated autopeptidases)
VSKRGTHSGSTRPRVSGSTTIQATGILTQGTPLIETSERTTIPADKINPGEFVFRIAGDMPEIGLADRDLLIVEPRTNGNAATGEFVIVTLGHDAFIGRYWKKHGARSLLDDAFNVIAQGPTLRVLGAVTLILRDETH